MAETSMFERLRQSNDEIAWLTDQKRELEAKLSAAVAAEREACAQLVSNWPGRIGAELVAAIRARGGA